MTYRWRDGEVEAVTEYAPYVMREEEEPLVSLALDKSKCGTFTGYKQHRRRGQEACDRCKAAAAESAAAQRSREKNNTT